MFDNVIRKYTYLKVPTGALKVGIFPYYVIRHGLTILLVGSLIITVHHRPVNNVIHVHDEPST